MRNYRLLAAAGLICLALGACHRKAEAPEAATAGPEPIAAVTGFEHDADLDPAGYYTPLSDVSIGNFHLSHIAMGAPSDFAQWEDGERDAAFGPIILDFDDITSRKITNELGGEGYEKTIRVKPDAYSLFPGEVKFAGTDPVLGQVLFEGHFDQAALDQAKKDTSSGDTPVLTADLQIGDMRFDNVSFSYWIGD